MQHIHVFGNDGSGFCVAVGDDGADLFVDLSGHVFAVAVLMADVISEEDILAALLVVDGSDGGGHAVAGDHLAGNIGCLFDILRSAGRNIVKNKFLSDTSAQADHDLLQHAAAGKVHLIPVRKRHGIAAGSHTGGNDGDGVDLSDIGKLVEKDGMSGLVVGGDPLFFFRDHMALLLCADADLDEGVLDIGLDDISPVCLGGCDGSLVEKVFQIRAGEACRGAGDLREIDVVAQGLVGRVDLEDILSALDIGTADRDLAVEAAGTKDGGVKHVDTVGGRHDNDALVDAETVHLDKELVQGLLALIVGAAQTCAPAAGDSVDLIDKYDAGRILLGILKHVADTGCADTDEHFHEIRTGNSEKGHFGLAGNRPGQKGLARSGSALEQDALGDPGADLGIFFGAAQEIDDLLQISLLLVETGDLFESHILTGGEAGFALAEIHHAGIAAAHTLPGHQIEEQKADAHDKQHGKGVVDKCIFGGNVVHDCHDTGFARLVFYVRDHGRVQDLLLASGAHDGSIAGGIIPVGCDLHALHQVSLKILDEIFPGIDFPSRGK